MPLAKTCKIQTKIQGKVEEPEHCKSCSDLTVLHLIGHGHIGLH